MNANSKEAITIHTNYLREQIRVLADHAMRDNKNDPNRVEEIAAAYGLSNQSPFDDMGRLARAENVYIDALHLLSSLVDKKQAGGWIADRSAVYRVEQAGRSYRNVDLISVQMANKDHNGADDLFARAREVAAALNSL